jgi:hypothetical protein
LLLDAMIATFPPDRDPDGDNNQASVTTEVR